MEKPSPSAPSRFSAGTITFSSRTSCSVPHCRAITGMSRDFVKPGVSLSTRNTLMPFGPLLGSVTAATAVYDAK